MQKATQNIWREICEEGRNLVPFVNVREKAAKDSFVGWKLKGKKIKLQGQLFFICEGVGSSFNEQSFFKSPCNVFWQNNTENVPDL